MMTMYAGYGVLCDEEYTKNNIEYIKSTREFTACELKKIGFEVTDSKANFLFAKHNKISGEEIYSYLRENGVLVRHFNKENIKDYNRITIGKKEDMEQMINILKKRI